MTKQTPTNHVSINTSQKLTPMLEQYRSIKKTLKEDTALFFRLGDFYEMFFEDAVRCSEILDITLTGREGGKAGRIPMCGIPYHAFQGYVRTLLDHNLKVAICEQVGDPKTSKGLVERKITRMISPATYLEDESQNKNFEYLAALTKGKETAALSYLELSTGQFYVKEVPHERLESELTLLGPREIILPAQMAEDDRFVTFLKSALNVTLTVYEDWVFDTEESFRYLQEGFGLASKQSIGFYEHETAVQAAGAILYYLKDHLHEALGHIEMPSLLESQDFMILDRQTQRSLELVKNLQGDKSGPTLFSVINQTLTSMGSRTLYQWLTHPLLNRNEILKRQDSVEAFSGAPEKLQSLRRHLSGVKDMERTLSRLNYGVANARDLINLKIFLERVPDVQSLLRPFDAELVKELLESIQPFKEIQNLIEQAIVDEPPLTLKDGGMIRDGFDSKLDEIRHISKNGKQWILDYQKKEIERTGIKTLRIKYSRVFGYALEVSKGATSKVPEDYIRRQTLANAERFVTPELKEWDSKITGAEDQLKNLEYEIFNQVRETLLKDLNPLQKMARAIGVLDALLSLSILVLQRSWVRPDVVDTGELSIKGGRHPVVESMLPAGTFVENDTSLNTNDFQLVLLTGPNMAGKSTYIRQIAQIVLLAQMGSFIPAKSATLGLCDRIFTRIGASDDLAKGESTFMVEMVETAHILQKATNRSLLILDEVGRGTSTFDGVSIAWAICEYLAQNKTRPRTLFATHYHELTQLEDHFTGIKNFNITVRDTKNGIVFLRKVVRGGSDRSYGIHVAELAGIPKQVTERAKEILNILESENTEATQIIEGKKIKKQSSRELNEKTLFDFTSAPNPVLEELEELMVETLTPIEALNKLAELKEKLNAGQMRKV